MSGVGGVFPINQGGDVGPKNKLDGQQEIFRKPKAKDLPKCNTKSNIMLNEILSDDNRVKAEALVKNQGNLWESRLKINQIFNLSDSAIMLYVSLKQFKKRNTNDE